MYKILLITVSLLIGCTNTEPTNLEKESVISESSQNNIVPSKNIGNNLNENLKMTDLKKGECVKLIMDKGDLSTETTIKFALSGKLSYGFLRYDKAGKTEFSSLPKVDFKKVKIERTSCPEKVDSLADLHYKYIDSNPKPYAGKNTDVKTIEVGQCVHFGSSVGKVTAFKEDMVALKILQGKYSGWDKLPRERLNKIAVLTDCLDELHSQYKKQANN